MNALAHFYEVKPSAYFGGSRQDIVDALKTDKSSAILELGCGTGATGVAALSAGKAGRYVGLEIDPSAAREAQAVLSEVLVGDVAQMDLTRFYGQFDAVIASEVLEHLTDPAKVLRDLALCIKPGGMIYASSPNISHWKVIRDLIRGHFDYAPDGVMDESHLRWFTPRTFRAMFEGAGILVTSVAPLVPLRAKARVLNGVTGGRFSHLFAAQIMLVGQRR